MSRIEFTGDMKAAAAADLVMEAVFENIEVKRDVFTRLGSIVRPEAPDIHQHQRHSHYGTGRGGSQSRTFSRAAFLQPGAHDGRGGGDPGMATSDDVFAAGRRFVLDIGKEPIMVNRDVAGFVINRINFPSTIEAMKLVEAGVTTVEDVDKGLRLASGRRMGIFETGDMVGLDVTYGAMMAVYQETGDPRWYPPLLLRRKVKAGHLGRKTVRAGTYTVPTASGWVRTRIKRHPGSEDNSGIRG